MLVNTTNPTKAQERGRIALADMSAPLNRPKRRQMSTPAKVTTKWIQVRVRG